MPAWGRLKATLLASAAAAHTAAAADLAAAAVRADAAAREWVDTAADIFEHHVTSKAALAAAASKASGAPAGGGSREGCLEGGVGGQKCAGSTPCPS